MRGSGEREGGEGLRRELVSRMQGDRGGGLGGRGERGGGEGGRTRVGEVTT